MCPPRHPKAGPNSPRMPCFFGEREPTPIVLTEARSYMSAAITCDPTPEERELEKKNTELSALEAELIQRELDLVTLRTELSEFEARYLLTVGILYAKLDDIEAQIAEILARRRPHDRVAQTAAGEARARATESAQTATPTGEPQQALTEDLKALYQQVAKRLHPDLASSDVDRERRQQLMTEVNLAYERRDETGLRNILADWQSSPELVEGDGIGADLIRAIRKTAQIQKRLPEITSEIEQLNASDLNLLRLQILELEKQGRDGLEEMASKIETQIANAEDRRSALTAPEAGT